jgi:hypothetical protein
MHQFPSAEKLHALPSHFSNLINVHGTELSGSTKIRPLWTSTHHRPQWRMDGKW